jgi:hypothetical protein
MIITHEFDEHNNLTFIVKYHGLTFRYKLSESYLIPAEVWDGLIKQVEKAKDLSFNSGDVQSWNDTLSLHFPAKYKKLYIEAIKEARKDPRISSIDEYY